jgi:predicted Zn-dependent protease
MAGFFYKLGQMVGSGARKANWLYRSMAGTPEEAARAEVAIGQDLARAFLEEAPLDPDPDVAHRLNALTARLSATLKRQAFPYFARCVQTADVNAFAFPGGFLFLTRPLIEVCQSDLGELAFVVGHEMGHVQRRHAVERIMSSSALDTALARLTMAGGVFGRSLALVAARQVSQGYSQDQELEADQFAALMCRAADFDPAVAVRLLDRLRGAAGDLAGVSRYFTSHPPFEVRIAAINRALRGG